MINKITNFIPTNINYSTSTNTIDFSVVTNTNYHSAATNTGYHSIGINTGYHSAATSTGNFSVAANTGNFSAATVSEKESIAIVTGYQGKTKGILGSWLVLTKRDKNYHIIDIQAVKIDGHRIKPDTFYVLENKKINEIN